MIAVQKYKLAYERVTLSIRKRILSVVFSLVDYLEILEEKYSVSVLTSTKALAREEERLVAMLEQHGMRKTISRVNCKVALKQFAGKP